MKHFVTLMLVLSITAVQAKGGGGGGHGGGGHASSSGHSSSGHVSTAKASPAPARVSEPVRAAPAPVVSSGSKCDKQKEKC